MADEFAKFAGIFPIERATDHLESFGQPAEGTMPLEEFAQAELAVEEALRGDFTLLAERQRTATVLLPIERAITAAILEKKLRKPSHRPADPGTAHKTWLLAFAVNELMREGEPEKSAVSRVAQVAKTSISTVCKGNRSVAVVCRAVEITPWP